MRKQILLLFFTSFIHISSYADVIQTFDDTKNCTRYIISRTDVETQRLQDQGGQIVHKKMVYGFSLENLRIDFDKREVRVDIIQKIAFSLNKPLIRSAKVSKSLEAFDIE